ncbi:MAG: type II secretion system protein [Candidatus Pacebacteria bacterium]|nr:type II secretion system protein [Candidatus Paceibacterota bacterium]
MKQNKIPPFTFVEIMLALAIFGLLIAFATTNIIAARNKTQNEPASPQKYLRVGSGDREYLKFTGSQTGVVTRVLELHNTPMYQPFPIVEIMLTNDSGKAYLRSAFPRNPDKLMKDDLVLVTSVEHADLGGGKNIYFVTKLFP